MARVITWQFLIELGNDHLNRLQGKYIARRRSTAREEGNDESAQ